VDVSGSDRVTALGPPVAVERHTIRFSGGRLAMCLHRPADVRKVPCVVACHGLHASKDSDKYLLLGDEFARAGIALARFDFRGCGESTGREDETTVETRIEDTRAVLGCLAGHRGLDGAFGLLGSSLGGFVALWVASERADAPPVVTWNAPADLAELPEPGDRGGLGPAFLRELRSGRWARTPDGVRAHLVIVSAGDDVVPPAHGRTLVTRAAEPRDLLVIAGADHRLTDPAHRSQAVAASLDWFRKHLCS
jgi:uncharacterized protein